jgi:hypothetical protein
MESKNQKKITENENFPRKMKNGEYSHTHRDRTSPRNKPGGVPSDYL